jgi:hypothetical protein
MMRYPTPPAQADTSGEFPIFRPPLALIQRNAFGQRQVANSTKDGDRLGSPQVFPQFFKVQLDLRKYRASLPTI